MSDAAAEKAIKAEYKDLKKAINTAPGDFNTFKRLTDVFTVAAFAAGFADKLSQVAGLTDKLAQASTLVSTAGHAAGPFIPAVSAALGAVTLVTTGAGLWKGLGKGRSDDTVRGYKTQFNRAARGFLGAQVVSTVAMTFSALASGAGEILGLGAANGSTAQMIIGTTLGVVGAIAGWKAHANAGKLSVYSTAMRNAKNAGTSALATPVTAAVTPATPTVV